MNNRIKSNREKIIDAIKWTPSIISSSPTGQTVGMVNTGVRLISEEMEITIECGYYRSQLKNRVLAYKMFEKCLDEIEKR